METDFLEVKVSIRDEDQKLCRKFPVYEQDVGGITISHEDLILRKMVEDTLNDFKGDQQSCDITVDVKYIW